MSGSAYYLQANNPLTPFNMMATDSVGNVVSWGRSLFSAVKTDAAQTGGLSFAQVKVTFTSKIIDLGAEYDAPNSRFTANASGFYLFTAALVFTNIVSGKRAGLLMKVNGSINTGTTVCASNSVAGTSYVVSTCQTKLVQLSAGDYVEVYADTDEDSKSIENSFGTYFSGFRIPV
jgi:hypothetical protein